MPLQFDLDRIDRLIRHTAEAEIMPRFRRLAEGDVIMKGVNDPVTVADRAAEARLAELLKVTLPGSVVVGEESVAADKTVLARLSEEQTVWIIDPIDGTRNFVAGKPEFAVMVALVSKGQTVGGWIHDPVSGDTLMGEQGGGVWLRGEKVGLAAWDTEKAITGLVSARLKKFIQDPKALLLEQSLPPVEIGSCCGFDYPRFFEGPPIFADAATSRVGFSLYRNTNAWDHAAGVLLHAEAGGYSADWQGNDYDMTKSRNGLFLAPGYEEWKWLTNQFRPLIEFMNRQTS